MNPTRTLEMIADLDQTQGEAIREWVKLTLDGSDKVGRELKWLRVKQTFFARLCLQAEDFDMEIAYLKKAGDTVIECLKLVYPSE